MNPILCCCIRKHFGAFLQVSNTIPVQSGSISGLRHGADVSILRLPYPTHTNHAQRRPNVPDSADTYARAAAGKVELLPDDTALVSAADYILSIVPPRDAYPTAKRIAKALHALATPPRSIYYLDLNAISPRSARAIGELFEDIQSVKFIDGGIIGGAPRQKGDQTAKTAVSARPDSEKEWAVPSVPVSGPWKLSDAHPSGGMTSSSRA